jgi:prophage antirepressor-like protein
MNELTIFRFEEGREVRTVMIDGNPWWVAKDAGDILGIQNVRQNLQEFPENEKADVSITYGSSNSAEQKRTVLVINEPGLYRLIFQSRKPEAERFKTWVFTEVLPAIRKTGAYSMLKRDYDSLQNVYRQIENYRIKYINLLDNLEKEGMAIREIWKLSRVDQTVLQKIRELLPTEAPKQAPEGTTLPPEAPQEAKRQESIVPHEPNPSLSVSS